jgi:hypothetical protein
MIHQPSSGTDNFVYGFYKYTENKRIRKWVLTYFELKHIEGQSVIRTPDYAPDQ